MAFTFKSLSIIVASVLAILLIAGAYVLSSSQGPATVNAASTDELLKQYASKDSDGDGLSDWEEALYGTNPQDAHSVSKTLTDSEAVAQGLVKPKFSSATPTTASTSVESLGLPGPTPAADSLTAQLGQTLIVGYLQNRTGATPDKQSIDAFVSGAVDTFVSTHTIPDSFTQSNVRVAGAGASSLRAYASAVETSASAHTAAVTKSETDYLSDAINKNDTAALKNVRAIGSAYTAGAAAFIKISVPSEAAAAHLALANAFARMGTVTSDMGALDTDPVRALLGIGAYEKAAKGLSVALAQMDAVFKQDQVSFSQGEAGYSLFSALEQAADYEAQAANKATP